MAHRSTPLETDKMPPGIPYIIGNEAAERFSFYGMRTILIVFMTQYLLFMDNSGGTPVSGTEAVGYFHQFVKWVYLTPLIGALLSDIFLGKYRTILWLSIFYCLGHGALACMGLFGESRWWLITGLALICIGAGGIKPCVSAHVGDQFGPLNQHLISRIYNWFYFSINFGAIFSTLLTPWLLEYHGPHWAFGVPGVLMAIATFMFWLGRNRFVHIPAHGWGFFKESFSWEGITALGKLVPLFFFIAVFWSLYDQTGSSWILQAKQMDLHFLGIHWLESQVQAVNPVLILIFIPTFTLVLYPALNRVFRLTPLRKIGIGLALMAATYALSTLVQSWIDAGQRPSIGWQMLCFILITASEVMVAIVGLEFAYTQAPRTMKSWVMSLFWLSVWLGNDLTDRVNRFISTPSAAQLQYVEAVSKLPENWRESPRNIVLPGYDGITGTMDDFIARCRQGRLESIEIPGGNVYQTAASRIEATSAETFPTEEDGKGLIAGLKDPWGNPLAYRIIDSSNVRIYSKGPGKEDKTQWSQGLIIKRKDAPRLGKKDTWLAKRKAELGITEVETSGGFQREAFSGGESKLEGAAYFRFFTWLILGAFAVYLPFSLLYRPKTYLQESE